MKKKIIPLLLAGTLFLTASCDLLGSGSGSSGTEKTPEPTTDVFEESKFPFYLVIHANGSKIAYEITEKTKITLKDIEPKLDEYIFDGWYYDENYQEKFPYDYINYKNKIDNLYAKFILKENITLKINYPDKTEEFKIPLKEEINLNNYEKEYSSLSFENWYLDKEYTSPVKEEIFEANKEFEFYAKYKELELKKVKIYIGDEIIEKDIYETKYINIKDFVQDSETHYLEGWYKDETLTQKADNNFQILEDTNLYVNYIEKEEAQISFYIDGVATTMNKYIGTTLDLDLINTKKDNFTFKGWYYDETFETPVNSKTVKITSDLKLYAKYEENEKIRFVIEYEDLTTNEILKTEFKTLYTNQKLSLSELNDFYKSNDYVIEKWFISENELFSDNEVLIYTGQEEVILKPKLYCNLSLYANGELISEKKIPYTKTLTAEDLKTLYGESFEIEEIVEESLKLTTHYELKVSGENYLDFDLYDSYAYEIENDTIVIDQYLGNNAIVKIPAYIDDKPVVKIDDYAFDTSLISVTIPSTVTTISSKAFANCSKLVEVYNLSDAKFTSKSVPNIYKEKNTPSKVSIYEKEYVLYKNDNTTYLIGYLGIKPKLTLPLTIENKSYVIYDYAFYNNKYINTLIIPEGMTSISNYAFKDCYDLYRVVLPKTLTTLGKECFANCFNLIEIYDMSNLNIKINDTSNEGLGQYALYISKDAEFTDNLEIHETSTDEQYHEFYTYSFLSKYYLLGINRRKSNYTHITFPEYINDKTYEIYHHAFYGDKSLLSITFPDTIEVIGNGAFENCGNLKEVNLNNVRQIGDFAFFKCYRISKITIPSSIISIGKYAFADCTNLISFDIEEGISRIGEFAISNCTSLTKINLPKTIVTVGEGILQGSNKITSITIPFVGESRESSTNYYFGYIFGGKSEDSGNINLNIPSSLKEVTILDDLTIENQAFWRCSNITKITFGNTKCIRTSAFGYCTKLKTIAFSSDNIFEVVMKDAFYQTTITTILTDNWTLLKTNFEQFKPFLAKEYKVNTYTQIMKIDATISKNLFKIGDKFDENEKQSLIQQIEYVLKNGKSILIKENGTDLYEWNNYSVSIPIKTNSDSIITSSEGEYILAITVSNLNQSFVYKEGITIEKRKLEI